MTWGKEETVKRNIKEKFQKILKKSSYYSLLMSHTLVYDVMFLDERG